MNAKHNLYAIILISFILLTTCSIKNSNKNNINFNNISKDIKQKNIPSEVFESSPILDTIKNKMLGKSMPYNANIDFDDLSYLKLTYYGFDGKVHLGEMVVNKEISSDVLDIFRELYENKYPIEKIKLIDEYDANDNLSMLDNNTSSFCYRTIKGSEKISNHGKGLAIDINPFQNPHVIGNTTNPKEASYYADRSKNDVGMIKENDICYNAFIKRGFKWGGHWKNPDYQHFEKSIN